VLDYFAETWSIWLSAFLVLSIWSYLFKDNPVYRVVMQVFIGINVGYAVITQWRDILYPRWWLPMLQGLDALLFGGPGSPWGALWVMVGLLGLLWYFQLSRRYMWLSRIVIGVVIGIGAGITFRTQLGTNLPQVSDTFRPLAPQVVGPQPRVLYDLPPATAEPLFIQHLGFFPSGPRVVCVEMLNGVVLWEIELEGAVRSLTMRSSGLIDVAFEGGRSWIPISKVEVVAPPDPYTAEDDYQLTKPQILGSWRGYVSDTSVTFQGPGNARWRIDADLTARLWLIAPPGEDPDETVAILVTEEATTAYSLAGQQAIWTHPGGRHASFDGSTILIADGSRLLAIDAMDGVMLWSRDLPAAVVSPPVPLRMDEPLEDRVSAAAALENGQLVAIVQRDQPALNRAGGEILWMTDSGPPKTHLFSTDGTLLATGADGGHALLPPRPTPRLTWQNYLDNWIFVLTVVSVMTYFFFSFQHQAKFVRRTAVAGRWMLMIGFGAFFGNTVMTRMSFLLDRLMFLIEDWLRPLFERIF
jgi:hypothetical protein